MRRVVVAPAETPGRGVDCCGELAPRGRSRRIGGRVPREREIARLREQLLEPEDRAVTHVPLERAGSAAAGCLRQLDRLRETDGDVTAQRIPEPPGLERQRMGVEVAPATGRSRSDRRQAVAEDRVHRARERERDRAAGIQHGAGSGLDERLRSRTGREPAQPSGRGHPLPGTRRGGDRDASRPFVCRCRDADVDRLAAHARTAACARDRARAARPSAPACRTARRSARPGRPRANVLASVRSACEGRA